MKRSISLHSQLLNMVAFIHTVETGSFTAAAVRMGVSKSATGKNVARLEERLGVKLLNRTTRCVSLTDEGTLYYQSCLKVIDELTEAESLLAFRQNTVSGKLCISLPMSYGRLHVMPILNQLAKNYPELRMNISFTDRKVDLIEENIDLVIRLGDQGNYTSISGRKIGSQRSVICASPDYLRIHGIPHDLTDLASHSCIGFAYDNQTVPWVVLDKQGNTLRFTPDSRFVISHGEALRDATVSGLGIAHMATWLVGDDIEQGRLLVIPIETPPTDFTISALWPTSKNLSPRIRVVVDALLSSL